MEGKIKIRIGSKASFWNKRYTLFLDEDLVGQIDYKNPQIVFGATIGSHKLVVKGKYFEKELDLNLHKDKLVLPIELNESCFSQNSENRMSKILQGVNIGFLIVYFITFAYFTIVENKNLNSSLIIPIILIFSLNKSPNKGNPFDLEFKNF